MTHSDPAGSPGPRLLVAAGLVWLGADRVLVHRRSPDAAVGAGALELPGGKVERGEAPVRALARELGEEWGAKAGTLPVGPVAAVLHHCYRPPGPEVILLVYHVDGSALARDATGPAAWGLRLEPGLSVHAYEPRALPVEAFLAADRAWVARVAAGLVVRPEQFGGEG